MNSKWNPSRPFSGRPRSLLTRGRLELSENHRLTLEAFASPFQLERGEAAAAWLISCCLEVELEQHIVSATTTYFSVVAFFMFLLS